MRGSILKVASLFALLFFAGGCQEPELPASTSGATASSTDSEDSSTSTETGVQQADPKSDSNPTETADTKAATAASTDGADRREPQAQFKPPFPQRIDFFAPPERVQGVASKTTEHDETIELQGFANVDEPKVVLAVDGVITPISQGGKKFGIQVITIEPPKVVLQRGRERWTATLDN